jgi:hypothetical protein
MNDFPSVPRQLLNFAKAVTKHSLDGWQNVGEEVYNQRTDACKTCEFRVNARCRLCGCFISEKALWASEDCPQNRWTP